MALLGKLRKRAKELDGAVKKSLMYDPYDFQSGDDRDLLEAAIFQLERQEQKIGLVMAHDSNLIDSLNGWKDWPNDRSL